MPRSVTDVLRNTSSAEIVYGITSHTQDSASAACLLAYNRDQWCRDAVFVEDRSPVRKGFGPQNMPPSGTWRSVFWGCWSGHCRKRWTSRLSSGIMPGPGDMSSPSSDSDPEDGLSPAGIADPHAIPAPFFRALLPFFQKASFANVLPSPQRIPIPPLRLSPCNSSNCHAKPRLL